MMQVGLALSHYSVTQYTYMLKTLRAVTNVRKISPRTTIKKTYQYADISKHTFRGFIKDTAHLVLKVLCRDFI
jgi:uncharacterized protein YbcV (DUF1398 family)